MRFFIWLVWLIYWLLMAGCGAIVLGDLSHFLLAAAWFALCFAAWFLGNQYIERIK